MDKTSLNFEVKECPVCHARLFSDMDTCFSCLHRFSEDSPVSLNENSVNSEALDRDKNVSSPAPLQEKKGVASSIRSKANSSSDKQRSSPVSAKVFGLCGNEDVDESKKSSLHTLNKEGSGTLSKDGIPGFSTISTLSLSTGEQVSVKIDVQVL